MRQILSICAIIILCTTSIQANDPYEYQEIDSYGAKKDKTPQTTEATTKAPRAPKPSEAATKPPKTTESNKRHENGGISTTNCADWDEVNCPLLVHIIVTHSTFIYSVNMMKL